MVQYGVQCYGMEWYGVVRHGMVWYNIVAYYSPADSAIGVALTAVETVVVG